MINPNPEWAQRACRYCSYGSPRFLYSDGRLIHTDGFNRRLGWCTAPTPEQYIEQLEQQLRDSINIQTAEKQILLAEIAAHAQAKARIKELEAKAAPPIEAAPPSMPTFEDIYPGKTPAELCPPGATYEFRVPDAHELLVSADSGKLLVAGVEWFGGHRDRRLVIIPPALGPAQEGFEHLPAYREPKGGEWVLEKDENGSPLMGAQPFQWSEEQSANYFDGPRWILRKSETAVPPAAPEVDQAAADGARALELLSGLPLLVTRLDTNHRAACCIGKCRCGLSNLRAFISDEVLSLVERAKARGGGEAWLS